MKPDESGQRRDGHVPEPELYDNLAECGPNCPSLEEWAVYTAGLSSEERMEHLIAHAAECAACGGLLADMTEVLPEKSQSSPIVLKSATPDWKYKMAERMATQSGNAHVREKSYRWMWLGAAAAIVILVLVIPSSFSVSWLLARSSDRIHEFRIAGMPYRPQDGKLGSANPESATFLLAKLLISIRDNTGIGGSSWTGVHGRAVLLDARDDSRINASIELLSSAHAGDPTNTRIANDLAVALLVRSDQDTRSRELDRARAVEALKDCLKTQQDSTAYFNLALAYHRQNMPDKELEAWQKFLNLEPKGGWADEARKRITELANVLRDRNKLPMRPEDSIIQLAIRGFEPAKYADPGSIAQEMASRGDTWLSDFLHEAQRPTNREAIAALQSAATALNEGKRNGEELSRAARDLFLTANNRPGVDFASYELAYALQLGRKPDACVAFANEVLPSIAEKKYAWLDIQLRLVQSSCLGAAKSFRPAYEAAETARISAEALHYSSLEIHAMGMESGALREVGSYKEALPLDAQSLDQYWSGKGGALSNAYQAYYGSAVALQGLHYPQAAAAFMEQALLIAGLLPNRNQEAIAKSRYAEILDEAGDPEGAYKSLSEVEEFFRKNTDGEESARVYAQLPRARLDGRQGKIKSGLETVAKLELIMKSRENSPIETQMWHVKAELMARDGQFGESEKALRQLLMLGDASRASAPVIADRSALARRVAEASGFLVDRYLSAGRTQDAWDTWTRYNECFRSVQTNPSSALVVYALLPSGPVALILTANGVHAEKLRNLADMLPLIRELRELSASPETSIQRLRVVSRSLGKMLIEPIKPYLQDENALYIAAEEPFSVVPFGALAMADDRWLAEQYRVIYSPPGAGGANRIDTKITSDLKLVAASYGGFSTVLGNVLPALNLDIELQGQAAAKAFPNHDVMTGDASTVSNVIKGMPDAGVFHFSGHAITAAADAAMVFSPDGKVGNRQLLWASQLSPSMLSNLRLAVLAACSTGRVPDENHYPGSDMARAFLLGGVPAVIASGWDVDSQATSDLIRDFYYNIHRGITLEIAISEAEAKLRHQQAFAHPYYWAAFALQVR